MKWVASNYLASTHEQKRKSQTLNINSPKNNNLKFKKSGRCGEGIGGILFYFLGFFVKGN
jgi:hypothetical protein